MLRVPFVLILLITIAGSEEEAIHGPLFLPQGQMALGGEFGHIHIVVDLIAIAKHHVDLAYHIRQQYEAHAKLPDQQISSDIVRHQMWVNQQMELLEELFGLVELNKQKRQFFAALGSILGLAAGGLSIFGYGKVTSLS